MVLQYKPKVSFTWWFDAPLRLQSCTKMMGFK